MTLGYVNKKTIIVKTVKKQHERKNKMFSLIYVIISVSLFNFSNGQEKLESICNINGEKALQRISEKFLSISIDPAVLLAGLNLSDTSLALAEHMSPAYIRIAGPSTKFVHYVDSEGKSADSLSEDGSSVVVTPSMWFGINEWLRLANLTPVFGINDAETASGGVWNPKSTLPLLEISDKLNVRCYWQLGFGKNYWLELFWFSQTSGTCTPINLIRAVLIKI
ncbi:hypothetical protein NQ317_006855 [Molorchus minor]|uniref:Fe/B12 periplasmic-binding domain-containing protein n=1 Tax=Molorchus minor TaxID=1323400 RepID=A0ABQ9K1V8_9CUCU|nr:hypothetical protein NQ317_006855 [Molorchus minor]